ncbi:MAG: PAS domain-containing protein, partial [Candidatus Acidiferrales bacterium]
MEVEQPDWLQQMEGILESLNEGVLISDDCQNVIFTNTNFQEMTGIPRNELFGMDSYKFYTKEEAEFIEQQKQRSRVLGRNRFE